MGVTTESAVTPTVIIVLSLISSASCATALIVMAYIQSLEEEEESLPQVARAQDYLASKAERIRKRWHKSVAYRE